jgi:SAM-dependent methyltransferase
MASAEVGRVAGTEGYAEAAEELAKYYERLSFETVHADVLHLLPAPPSRVLDIGAGTGRDAAALALLGHRVIAVEPTRQMRELGQSLHEDVRIEWVDDSLPSLTRVTQRGERFDLVLLSAVLMHLDAAARAEAIPNLSRLLAVGGLMVFSLRYGPVPPGRRMFDVPAGELRDLAKREGLSLVHEGERPGRQGRKDVRWSVLAFRA